MEKHSLQPRNTNTSNREDRHIKMMTPNCMRRSSWRWPNLRRTSFRTSWSKSWTSLASARRIFRNPPCITLKIKERECRLCKCNNKLSQQVIIQQLSPLLTDKRQLQLSRNSKIFKWSQWKQWWRMDCKNQHLKKAKCRWWWRWWHNRQEPATNSTRRLVLRRSSFTEVSLTTNYSKIPNSCK